MTLAGARMCGADLVMQYKKPNEVDLQLSNSAMEPINHRRIEEHGS
jgi:hypothetical protein